MVDRNQQKKEYFEVIKSYRCKDQSVGGVREKGLEIRRLKNYLLASHIKDEYREETSYLKEKIEKYR